MTPYKDFDDWFLEIENYGTRAERFYTMVENEIPNAREGVRIQLRMWLEAAFECGAGRLGKPDQETE